MRNAAQKAFACLSSERGRVERAWPSPALSKDKMAFAKERRRRRSPFGTTRRSTFCSLQVTRFSAERPCGASSAAGPYCIPPPKYGTALSDGVPNTHMGENSRAIRPAYHRERRRRRTEDETPAAHGFPPAAVYAVHNKRSAPPAVLPAAYGLSGPRAASAAFPSDTAAFRPFPPSDAPLARGNGCHSARPRQQPSVRRMPSIQAFGPAGALWPLPNPRLEHRPQLVRNPAFFSAAGKADAPLFYAR